MYFPICQRCKYNNKKSPLFILGSFIFNLRPLSSPNDVLIWYKLLDNKFKSHICFLHSQLTPPFMSCYKSLWMVPENRSRLGHIFYLASCMTLRILMYFYMTNDTYCVSSRLRVRRVKGRATVMLKCLQKQDWRLIIIQKNTDGIAWVPYVLHMTLANTQNNLWLIGYLWETCSSYADHETIWPRYTFEINFTEDITFQNLQLKPHHTFLIALTAHIKYLAGSGS